MTTQAQPSGEGAGEGRIVVGVDGSAPSKAALAWAIRQGRLTGAAVEALIAWEFSAAFGCPVPVAPDVNFEQLASEVLASAIAEVAGPDEQVTIIPTVVEGTAARVLLDASEGAELLVLGNRGHGAFVEAFLGSVGQHCVHHATCPVVVIRSSATGQPDRRRRSAPRGRLRGDR